jgi:predicted metal-binding protein
MPEECRTGVTVFVCVTCRGQEGESERPGRMFFDAVTAALRAREACGVTVTPVECLAVCKRPCTVALAAPGKWTYVVGDLDHAAHADDVIAAALSFGAAADGIIPWRERPASFRKGVVSRVPPLGFGGKGQEACAEGRGSRSPEGGHHGSQPDTA